MSTSPHESSPATSPPNAALGAAQSVLSFLGQASRENPSEASASTAVLGAATNVLSRLASSAHHHHHHASSASRPVPEVPEVLVEAPGSAEVPQRVVEPTPQDPTSTSSHGGASGSSGGVRTSTPPRGTARVTRPYPALHEPTPIPRPVPAHAGGVYRRSTGPYPDSETIWNTPEDRYYREKSVSERIKPTIESAKEEQTKAAQRARLTGWAQNIALGLQVFVGALTTALGAALTGKSTSVAISILGGTSTLIASYLARMRGSNEPQVSLFRSQALEHFIREIQAFDLDHGHEFGDKWDDKINGFRLGFERILGNQPGSVVVNADGNTYSNLEKGLGPGGLDLNAGLGGNGKYPMSGANGKLGLTTGMMV